MIELVPFAPEHFDMLDPDPVFADVKGSMHLAPLVRRGNGVSLIDFDRSEVLACYGYVWRRPNVYWLWMLPSARGSRNLIRIVRHAAKWIATLPPRVRIEAAVASGFDAGIRFALALGFEQETDEPARLYDGKRDYHLFARCTPAAPDAEARELRSEFLAAHLLLSAGPRLHDFQLRQGHGRICPL